MRTPYSPEAHGVGRPGLLRGVAYRVPQSVIRAVSLDCYGTLIIHRDRRRRATVFAEYLNAQGIDGAWDGSGLEALFTTIAWDDPDPRAPWRAVAAGLFARMGVSVPGTLESHAVAMADIFGPRAFRVYEDVVPALEALREQGYRLIVLSNWLDGLAHYLRVLDLACFFEAIVTSADEGVAKPDPGIFTAAAHRLDLPLPAIAHVGDDWAADVEGASRVGMHAVHLRRDAEANGGEGVASIATLDGLPAVLAELASPVPAGNAHGNLV